MKSYRNQRIITIQKATSDKNNLYAIFNLAATRQAMKNLSPTGFILFCYLNMNQRGFKLALSKKDFMDKTGISENTYLKIVHELIEKGYLVQNSEDASQYTFFEDANTKPVSEKQNIETINYKPTLNDREQLERFIDDVKKQCITIEQLEAALPECGYSKECTSWYLSELNKATGQ